MDKSLNALHQHFSQGLLLPPDAVNWLLDLFHAFQVFDDFAANGFISTIASAAATINIRASGRQVA